MNEVEEWSDWARCCLAGESHSITHLLSLQKAFPALVISHLHALTSRPTDEDEAFGVRAKKLLKSASKVAELAALLKRLHDGLESAIESRTVRRLPAD